MLGLKIKKTVKFLARKELEKLTTENYESVKFVLQMTWKYFLIDVTMFHVINFTNVMSKRSFIYLFLS